MPPQTASPLPPLPPQSIKPPRFPWGLAARREAPELLDDAGHDPAELAANLRDIRLVNRLGGGTRAVLRHLPDLLAPLPAAREATVLDLATGSADIPLAVARWARRARRPIRVIASDRSPEILAAAARQVAAAEEPAVALVRYDALAVPLPDGAVDVVLCSLALHHFPPADAVRLLREMARLGRRGFIVIDIRRSLPGFAAAWLASRLATRNRLTRHDMPLSVRRAYTPAELAALLAEAGIEHAAIHRHPLFRMAAVRGPMAEG